ncbi:hypothetical protein ACJ41O_012974 [Fusarium nematophilum]
MTDDASCISSHLTVIITTSVTPSAPSTELVASVYQSFDRHCPALTRCNVIVVFDAYDQIVSTARLKKGQVTAQQAADFNAYKDNVKKFMLEKYYRDGENHAFTSRDATAEYGNLQKAENTVDYTIARTRDKKLTFIEPSRRLGFGLAVRSALRITETPYVWIQQHDWALVADIPITSMLQIMQTHESDPSAPVKYVCLPGLRMLSYASSNDVVRFPRLKEVTARLTGDYSATPASDVKVPLTPLYFWHDKPHVASTAHYLERVFPTRLAMLRGDFIEDKIGQRARAQMKEGQWTKWATWLYYPDEGKQLCLRHLQGRTKEGAAGEAEKAAMWRQKNQANPGAEKGVIVEVDEIGEMFMDHE